MAPPAPRILAGPVFSQPVPTADPGVFTIKHPSDNDAYAIVDQLNKEGKLQAMPFPPPRGGAAEPRLTLTEVFGGHQGAIDTITTAGQIVFHCHRRLRQHARPALREPSDGQDDW